MITTHTDENGEIKAGPFLRTAYNYDMDQASELSGLKCEDPTKTQQQFKEEADINTIVERFGLTGELPKDLVAPIQGDFTNVMDYQSALNAVINAQDKFMQMPANVRARFHNDPQEFLEFTSDDKNREEAAKLGLLRPPPATPRVVDVRVIPEAPAPQKVTP